MSTFIALNSSSASGPVILSETVTLSSSGHPPIVCVHGLAASSALFRRLAGHFAALVPVLTFDWPGLGSSPWSSAFTSSGHPSTGLEPYVELLANFLTLHRLDRDSPVVLLAHGEGCAIALAFASVYPDLVINLILLCPRLVRTQDTLFDLYESLALERTPEQLFARLPALTMDKELPRSVTAELEIISRGGGVPDSVDGFVMLCRAMRHATPPDFDSLVAIRSLVVGGTRDSHVEPSMLAQVAEALHGTLVAKAKDDIKTFLHYGKERMLEKRWERETKVVMLDAGHWLLVEKPEQVASLVQQFLQG